MRITPHNSSFEQFAVLENLDASLFRPESWVSILANRSLTRSYIIDYLLVARFSTSAVQLKRHR